MIRHILREALFKPQIVKPAHGHQVAEPLMRELVQQQDVAVQPVTVSWRGAEQDRLFAQKRRSGMLHAAVGKTGDHHHVVLGEGKRLGKIVRKILDSVCGNLLHCFCFGFSFLQFRFADVKPRQSWCVMDFLKWPCGKGKQIGADGLSLGEADDLCV